MIKWFNSIQFNTRHFVIITIKVKCSMCHIVLLCKHVHLSEKYARWIFLQMSISKITKTHEKIEIMLTQIVLQNLQNYQAEKNILSHCYRDARYLTAV